MAYTTILYDVRRHFDISCNEYCVADMIQKLSGNPGAKVPGWCNASRQYLASQLGLSRQSIITIIQSLEQKNIILRDPENDLLKATQAWYDAVTGCKETLQGVKKLDRGCQETLQDACQETLHNNNILDNNRDNTIMPIPDGTGVIAPDSSPLTVVIPSTTATTTVTETRKEPRAPKLPFDAFYDEYGKKVNPKKVKAIWDGLSQPEQQAAIDGIPAYKRYQPEKRYRQDPERYLKNRLWLSEWPELSDNKGNPASTPKAKHPVNQWK